MQPTRAMRTRMAKWDPGMAVDIDTADAGTLGAIVVGPAANGDSTQLRVVFSDGTEEDQDVSSLRFPRDRCDEVGPDNSATSSATQRVQDQARSDEHEVSTSRSLPRQRTSSHEEVVQRQQQEEAEASIVTAELAAWLQKRNLMHRAHVIAASLEASGARMGEWVDTLDSLESDGQTMFTIFMQAVEKKYQDNPEKYGGQPRKAKTKASSMKAKPTLPRGAVVVTVNRGGAGFVCAADLCVKRVSPGGLSAAAGLQVGMQLARYSAGGRPHAMGGMSWSGFKEMCKQSPYPRIFTFVPAGDDSAKHTRSSAPIAEGIADRPPRKAKGAVKDERAVLSASEVSGASKHSVPEANAERERIQQTIAGPQVEAKRKEAETAAQAEIAAQMRARDEAKAKAEEQAAATVAKAAEEAAWKSAEQAAQALKEAEQKESEAALQEQNAREARLRPSGPVNVYISPLIDPTEARREAMAVRRMLREEGVTEGTMRNVARPLVVATPGSHAGGTRPSAMFGGVVPSARRRQGIPLAALIDSLTQNGGAGADGLATDVGVSEASDARGQRAYADSHDGPTARAMAMVAEKRGWYTVPLF